jgi:hypothetical protein
MVLGKSSRSNKGGVGVETRLLLLPHSTAVRLRCLLVMVSQWCYIKITVVSQWYNRLATELYQQGLTRA